jgi:hypothetical protein
MMEHFLAIAMQTCRFYALKTERGMLTEYEVQLYEAMSRLVTSHCKYHEAAIRASHCEAEQAAIEAEDEHYRWLREREQRLEADGE